MASSLMRFMNSTTDLLRTFGTAMAGVMPPLRSPDGTFGTQRMQSQERAAERKRSYPQD